MANMSYCRFQNTLSDLGDCQLALESFFAGDEDEDGDTKLSREELRAAKALIQCCLDIAGVVAEQAGLDLNDEDAMGDLESNIDEIMDKAQVAAGGK